MSDDPEDDKEAAQSVISIKPNKRSFFRFSKKERYVIWEWLILTQDFIGVVKHGLEAVKLSSLRCVPQSCSHYLLSRHETGHSPLLEPVF